MILNIGVKSILICYSNLLFILGLHILNFKKITSDDQSIYRDDFDKCFYRPTFIFIVNIYIINLRIKKANKDFINKLKTSRIKYPQINPITIPYPNQSNILLKRKDVLYKLPLTSSEY